MEESHTVTIAPVRIDEVVLPDTPYAMWVRGELDDFLHVPEGSRVEVIGGQIVVSPPPALPHNVIIQDVADTLANARVNDPSFPWRCIQVTNLNSISVGNGYIPDLMILDVEILTAANQAKERCLAPDQVELVVEVTSKSNADTDRRPQRTNDMTAKWCAYAAAEIPYYLLVDRDPKSALATLYSIPDQHLAAYLHHESWAFGETIHLPDPFSLDIDTHEWQSW
jgi:Uma2 family endonuclease